MSVAEPQPRVRNQAVALSLDGIAKSFGRRVVLHGLDLEIAAGEFVAIVGRSGCGKSTLLRVLAGLERPTSGSIQQDGVPLAGLNPQARVMFQDSRLLPWKTVLANVALGLPAKDREKATTALERVGLAERAGDWPSILSGGQRQRVALARALATHPRLLLLDEPLGSLDALTRLEMQQLIERLWLEQRFTAVLVTHDVAEAVALADRVLVLEEGEIAWEKRIDFPRPRERFSAEAAEVERRILERLLPSR